MALSTAVLSNSNQTLTLTFSSDPGTVAFSDFSFNESGTSTTAVNIGTYFISGTGTTRILTIVDGNFISTNFDVVYDSDTVTTTGACHVGAATFNVQV